jgi:hypothetical protein
MLMSGCLGFVGMTPTQSRGIASVDRMSATGCTFTTHLARRRCKTPPCTMVSCMRACTRCICLGYSDSQCRTVQTRGVPILSAAAVHLTVAPGSSYALRRRYSLGPFCSLIWVPHILTACRSLRTPFMTSILATALNNTHKHTGTENCNPIPGTGTPIVTLN